MDRLLLLLTGLFLAASAPAPATATFGMQQGPLCEPTLLATQVSLFCVPDMPTAQCCEPVVATVDLGGGFPCLCRVAAKPQLVMAGLNATRLLALYTSCGGLRPGGAHLAAACKGPVPPAAVVAAPPPAASRRKQSERAVATASRVTACDSLRLGSRLVNFCETELGSPSYDCCDSFFAVVGRGPKCFCNVSLEAVFVLSPLSSSGELMSLHHKCHGDNDMESVLHLGDVCLQQPSPPPPRDFECPPMPFPRKSSKLMWVGWVLALVFFLIIVLLVWVVRAKTAAPYPVPTGRLDRRGIGKK